MNKKLIARCGLLVCILILGGCSDIIDRLLDNEDTNTDESLATRQCSAFFHPELTRWVPEEAEGNIISFSDASGATALFTAGALVRSDAYAIDTILDGDNCNLVAQRTYTSSSPYPLTEYQYTHNDGVNSGIETEPLALIMSFKTDVGDTLPLQFHFNLNDSPEVNGLNNILDTVFYPSYSVGLNVYADVISQSAAEVTKQIYVGLDVPAEQKIVRVALARGVGLVQFELSDGRVFNRNL